MLKGCHNVFLLTVDFGIERQAVSTNYCVFRKIHLVLCDNRMLPMLR